MSKRKQGDYDKSVRRRDWPGNGSRQLITNRGVARYQFQRLLLWCLSTRWDLLRSYSCFFRGWSRDCCSPSHVMWWPRSKIQDACAPPRLQSSGVTVLTTSLVKAAITLAFSLAMSSTCSEEAYQPRTPQSTSRYGLLPPDGWRSSLSLQEGVFRQGQRLQRPRRPGRAFGPQRWSPS